MEEVEVLELKRTKVSGWKWSGGKNGKREGVVGGFWDPG